MGGGFEQEMRRRGGGPTKEIALVWCDGPGDREVRRVGFQGQVFYQGVHRNLRVMFGGKAFPLD